jgi:16S rRNA (adenine1518-N6/adenine1519-N6)-dimethyltransferase
VPSVLAQLQCDVRVLRAIPRTVFHPEPNVDSVLVALRRRTPPEPLSDGLRALVTGSFAHRRKTLVSSLALSGAAPGRSREQLRDALARIGHRPDVRAERLAANDFRALAAVLGL